MPERNFLMQSTLPKNHSSSLSVPQPVVGFNALFSTVTVITIGCIAGSVLIAFFVPEPTAYQQSAFDGLAWAWKLGFGAILGLLGGKIAH
jgi:hypothetical protein